MNLNFNNLYVNEDLLEVYEGVYISRNGDTIVCLNKSARILYSPNGEPEFIHVSNGYMDSKIDVSKFLYYSGAYDDEKFEEDKDMGYIPELSESAIEDRDTVHSIPSPPSKEGVSVVKDRKTGYTRARITCAVISDVYLDMMISGLSPREAADKHGVSYTTACRIRNKDKYSFVTDKIDKDLGLDPYSKHQYSGGTYKVAVSTLKYIRSSLLRGTEVKDLAAKYGIPKTFVEKIQDLDFYKSILKNHDQQKEIEINETGTVS